MKIISVRSPTSYTASTLFEYLNKEYRISVNRMAPDDVFLFLINPSSKNNSVKLIANTYSTAMRKEDHYFLRLTVIIVPLVCNLCFDFKLFG